MLFKKKKMHVNDNSQQLEICELLNVQIPIDSLYNMKNLISNNKNIDSPVSLKTFILKNYNLNDLQFFSFERFIKMNSINQLLQYIGGVASRSKTQIIKAIKEYFLKTNNKKNYELQHTLQMLLY
jgi:hypothetical protein